MKNSVTTAIDIGSSKITTLITTHNPEEDKTRVVGVSSIPSKGIRKSQVVDIEDAIESVTDSVESAERMAGFSIGEAIVSISGIHISSQNSKGLVAVQEPEVEITQNDVSRVVQAAKAIPIESAREILHVIPRHFIVDNQRGIKDPVGMSGVRLEVEAHLVTGSATNVRNLVKVISEIGVDTRAIVFSGLASSEAVLTDTEKELGVVLIDIGGGTTSLCVYVEGALSHSAVIPVGSKNITNDIAIGLRVSLDTAEKIKHILKSEDTKHKALDPKSPSSRKSNDEIDLHKLGIKDAPKKISRKTVLDGIVKPRVKEIFNLLAEELKNSDFANQTPAGVVITGGGGLIHEIDKSARRYLNLQARVAEPSGLTGLIDEINTPEYSTSVGLIKYALQNQESQSSSVFDLRKIGSSIQFKGSSKKLINFVKSFLP